MTIKLKDHQKENVQFVKDNHFVLIADEMGLGKTFSALASVKEQNHYPCLIICPKAVITNWEKEIAKIDHFKSVKIIKNTKDIPESKNGYFKDDYVIMNYEKWKLYPTFPKALSVIFDEVHYLKSYDAKRAINAREYVYRIKPSTVIGLSGTPVVNKGTEILQIINSLKENYIDKWWFLKSSGWCYQDEYNIYIIKPDKVVEVYNYLVKNKMMIRHKMDLSDLGVEKFREDVAVDINLKQYKKFVEDTYAYYGGFNIGGLQRIRSKIADLKVDKVIEYSKDLIESSNQKVIIFTTYQNSANLIGEKMKLKVHHGDIKTKEREIALNEFEKDPNVRAIVMSIGTGGIGLNMTHANHCVFADFDYSPSKMQQAEGRILRIGQEHDVVFHYLYADKTIDEDVVKALTEKSKIQNGIVDGEEYHYENYTIEKSMVEKLKSMFVEFGQSRKPDKK